VEYGEYVKQLTDPYLIDTTVDSKFINEAYERMKTEIRSSHILVRCSRGASPKDTLEAFNKISAIRERLLKGERFDTLARTLSEDQSAKTNFGDIGYMTSLNTVYEYENALYNTPVGSISKPVRSSFGYHLLKVTDIRPYKGEIRMAHVLVLPDAKDSTKNPKALIDSAYAKIKAGVSFGEVAKQYSNDPRSSNKEGVVPGWIGYRDKFPQKFKDIAFNLPIGQYSEPFETEYGWHIIKVLEKRELKPKSEALSTIKLQIARDDSRKLLSKETLIERLKKEYNFKEIPGAFEKFASKIDTSIQMSRWSIPEGVDFSGIVFTYADQKVTEKELANWIISEQIPNKNMYSTKEYIVRKVLDMVIGDKLLNHEKKMLEVKHPELRYLLKEYHDGMLLFDLTDKQVWTKAAKDSAGLANFYEQNKTKYMWGDRVEAAKYFCKDAKAFEQTKKLIAQREKKKLSDADIEAIVNKTDSNNLAILTKKFSKGENTEIDSLEWKPNALYITNYRIVEIRRLIAPEPKLLSECKGLVTADYQKVVEEKWIADIRKKYKVTVNTAVLEELKQKYR